MTFDLSTGKSISRVEQLREQGQAALKAAHEIQEKAQADSRGFYPDEQAELDQHLAKAKECVEAMKAARSDEEFIAAAGQAFGGGIEGNGAAPAVKTAGQRLSFKGMGGTLARSVRPDGVKALSPSGSAVVGQEFVSDPVALGKPALSLLDVIPIVQHSIPEFVYMRQTVRTNAAAVVAAGALVVIAHLSEGIPRHWVIDNASLEAFLGNELEFGLQQAVEAKVLADVNGTSGIQTQAYATSVLATLRKGITKVETAGLTASAFVLHPTDWEGVELGLAAQTAIEHMGLPYDPATRRLFGVPVTTSLAQAPASGT